MDKIRDSIKINQEYLLLCIQSEVLEKKSCWESYQSFCKKLGDDAMEYIDFEFWFMRFYNGETDVEYDRSKERKKKSLMDLPTELMTDIAKYYLSPFDMFMLSQVSNDLQSFCDTINPGFKRIELYMSPVGAEVTVTIIRIRYSPLENGYKMECGDDNITVENGCYLDGVRDVLMAHFTSKTSTINLLEVMVYSKKIEEWKKLIGNLSDSLFPSKISVEAVRFNVNDPIHFLPLLDLLTPGYLEEIRISSSPDFEIPYHQLAKTEQWKQAKRAILPGDGPSNPEYYPCLYHFERFEITVENLTMEFLIELSNILIASPNFKSCYIKGDLRFTAKDFASKIGGSTFREEVVFLDSIDDKRDFLEFSGGFNGKRGRLSIDRRCFDYYVNVINYMRAQISILEEGAKKIFLNPGP